MTDHVDNTFFIRLRAIKKLSQDIKDQTNDAAKEILDKWFPNFFGEQRFGINKQNPNLAQEILKKNSKYKISFDDKFKLQAYSSWLFNEYLKKRIKDSISAYDGDILYYKWKYGIYDSKNNTFQLILPDRNENFVYDPDKLGSTLDYEEDDMVPTWPVFGFNTMIAKSKTKAWMIEKSFMKKHNIDPKTRDIYKNHRIYWLRRILWIKPQNVSVRFQADDLIISFRLPGWSYASILIDELLKKIN